MHKHLRKLRSLSSSSNKLFLHQTLELFTQLLPFILVSAAHLYFWLIRTGLQHNDIEESIFFYFPLAKFSPLLFISILSYVSVKTGTASCRFTAGRHRDKNRLNTVGKCYGCLLFCLCGFTMGIACGVQIRKCEWKDDVLLSWIKKTRGRGRFQINFLIVLWLSLKRMDNITYK